MNSASPDLSVDQRHPPGPAPGIAAPDSPPAIPESVQPITSPIRALAIETSGPAGSVAIGQDGHLIDRHSLSTTAHHAADLLPAIDELVRRHRWSPAGLAHVYVSIGPGSFTGLRVAVTFARHLALAVGARLVAVPTLQVIAMAARHLIAPGGTLAVMLDAKRGQVFAAAFVSHPHQISTVCSAPAHASPPNNAPRPHGQSPQPAVPSILIPLSPPQLVAPAEFLASLPRTSLITGPGIPYHADAVAASGLPVVPEEFRLPSAADVMQLGWRAAALGEFTARESLEPAYVRIPEPMEKWLARQQIVK